ncbi:hypothetical protein F5Y15DRAFT_400182 [Xylariaceae sp. FL0016]|nr:hypothetical protein F5Y15DRAFT_400182 [Xylariaceae sp. FL0016]
MASEKGPVATEAPPPFPSTAPQEPISVEALAAEAHRAASQSLKRQREATPTSPSSVLPPPFNPESSPSKTARIAGLPVRHSPAPLTGAAALSEQRRREEDQYKLQVSGASENPAFKAQSALMSASALAMSRPQDAPQDAQQVGEAQPDHVQPEHAQTEHLQSEHTHPEQPQPDHAQPDPSSMSMAMPGISESDPKPDVSPQSATSMASLADGTGAPVAGSPGPMDLDARNSQASFSIPQSAQMEEKGVTSLSYPGILPPNANMNSTPARGMSMPMTPNPQNPPRSPNSKKHKCPYCETEFTRHHNLKSHLLTHSQEKPYVCQTCQMRFRRLHDLKRHSKLHTGEKPHVCPKCDRKFARGDALARHSKGPGGCVGRRSSLGSFLGEEDGEGASRLEGDDSVMSGVVYDGGALNETEMTEEDKRRLSGLPSIKAQHVQGNALSTFTDIPFSYQNLGLELPSGFSFQVKPEAESIDSNASQSPGASISSLPIGGGNPAMYAQNAMTESPKPLSPGLQAHETSNITRQRSPSLTAQFQQQHFGRHQTDRNTPPVPGFSAADAARYAASAAGAPVTAPPSQPGSGSSNQQQIIPGPVINHTRTSSGPNQNGGSGDSSSNNIFATDQGIWAYIHNLEEQVRQLSERVLAMETNERTQEERIASLSHEVTTLMTQLEPRTDVTEKAI